MNPLLDRAVKRGLIKFPPPAPPPKRGPGIRKGYVYPGAHWWQIALRAGISKTLAARVWRGDRSPHRRAALAKIIQEIGLPPSIPQRNPHRK